MWLCLKVGSENMVLVRLLQIGAKDLTVYMAIAATVGEKKLLIMKFLDQETRRGDQECPQILTYFD